MRIPRIGIMATLSIGIGLGVLGIDVGESVRTGAITNGSAQAKHHHHKHARKRHRRHHRRAPATEM